MSSAVELECCDQVGKALSWRYILLDDIQSERLKGPLSVLEAFLRFLLLESVIRAHLPERSPVCRRESLTSSERPQ